MSHEVKTEFRGHKISLRTLALEHKLYINGKMVGSFKREAWSEAYEIFVHSDDAPKCKGQIEIDGKQYVVDAYVDQGIWTSTVVIKIDGVTYIKTDISGF